MSSPFQKAFSSKNPLNQKKKDQTFTMGELNEMSKKQDSLSKKQALKLPQREGLGNPDYEMDEEQRFAGDDGYEDNGSSLKKKSPLNGSYYSPAGEPYVSHVGMIQNAVGAVQGALDSYYSDETRANRLESRSKKMDKKYNLGDLQAYDAEGKIGDVQSAEDYYKSLGVDTGEESPEQKADYAEIVKKHNERLQKASYGDYTGDTGKEDFQPIDQSHLVDKKYNLLKKAGEARGRVNAKNAAAQKAKLKAALTAGTITQAQYDALI
jgi:hypothetical protein